MSTPLPPSLVVLRPAGWKVLEIWLEATRQQVAAARHWLAQRRVARRQAAVRLALQHLSPHMLRDIGAPDDVIGEAMGREAGALHQHTIVLRGE